MRKLTNIHKHWHRSITQVWVKCRSSTSPLSSDDVLAPACSQKRRFSNNTITFCDDGTTNLSLFLFWRHSSHTVLACIHYVHLQDKKWQRWATSLFFRFPCQLKNVYWLRSDSFGTRLVNRWTSFFLKSPTWLSSWYAFSNWNEKL